MKIIFSRKGVDSAAGKCASAIVEGRPLSIPIPTSKPTTCYGDLSPTLSQAALHLSNGRLSSDQFCHLDPDIDRGALKARRPRGWRGAFGQVSHALSHLKNNAVAPGDIFLFWGLYRDCRVDTGRLRYVGPRKHAIFGWLQIGEIIDVGTQGQQVLTRHPWLRSHPHVQPHYGERNTIFVASESLSLCQGIPGYGVFNRPTILSKEGAPGASIWSVPAWLDPTEGGVGMTYHKSNRWLGERTLKAAFRGQEFIADAGHNIDAQEWLLALFRDNYEGLDICNCG